MSLSPECWDGLSVPLFTANELFIILRCNTSPSVVRPTYWRLLWVSHPLISHDPISQASDDSLKLRQFQQTWHCIMNKLVCWWDRVLLGFPPLLSMGSNWPEIYMPSQVLQKLDLESLFLLWTNSIYLPRSLWRLNCEEIIHKCQAHSGYTLNVQCSY